MTGIVLVWFPPEKDGSFVVALQGFGVRFGYMGGIHRGVIKKKENFVNINFDVIFGSTFNKNTFNGVEHK